MTELVSDVPISDAVGALAPSEALPVDDVSNAVTQIKQQRDLSLKGSLNQAVTIDPDKAAKNQALADKTGVPIDVINRNEEAIQQRARANDLRALVSTSPILEQQMMNPQFAALAHDDAENLNIFERTLRTYLGASTKSGLEQLLGVGAKLLDVATQGIGIGTSEQEGAVLFKGQPAELKKFQEGPAMFLTRFTKAMQEASTLSMKNLNPAAQLEYGDLRYATLESSKAAYLSPIKVVGDAIQSLPTSLALGVSVYLTKGVAARTEAAALGAGMSPTFAREAAIHAGAETMARLGAATEGAAGYGQQYMQTRQQADEVTDEQLQQSPQYQQLVAAGYSPEAARLRLSAVAAETSGAAGGAIDAITNYFGGRFLGTILTEGGRVAARTAKGFATEALTEAVQSGGEQLAQNVAVQHYLNPAQETLDQVAENIAQGFVVGGVTGGAFSAVAGAKYRQEAATHDAAVLTKLSELAANSELRARAPETFAQFVNAATADGPVEAVWIDAKGFAQSMVKAGMDEAQLTQKMPETAAVLPDALATDGKVRIPTGEFMATFPGTGIEKELIQQLSTTPEGPTAAEAHDAAFIEDSKRQVEAVLAKQEFTNAVKESMGSVERELLAQLTTANRFTKDVNTAYAKLMASFYTVMSQRVGLTPEQMYVKYPLRIQAESVTAPGTLNQPRSPTAVGYWEGPGGEHVETDHVPTFAERAVELGQHDRRWHRYPKLATGATIKSNRGEPLAQSAFDKPGLIIQHNVTAENLHHAAGLGGIPVPSLAITRAEDAMTGFGEITLIGRKEMANPRGYARTRVFGGDVYSPRYPEISYKLDAKALKKINEILAPYRKENERTLYGDEVNSASSLRNNNAFVRYADDTAPGEEARGNYDAVATSLLNEVGAQQRIFRGFNNAGFRRYIPHTLENVVKILKKNLRGGESESNIYGMGQLRAKFTPQFKSITEIREAAGRIVSDEDFEKVKKEVDNEFFAVRDALGPYSNRSDWATSFHSSDTAMAIIEDAQRMGINAAVKEYGFDELPEDVRQKMLEFVTRLRNMPTEYFEAKILREVSIGEFAAAVVPEGTDQKTLDLLRAHGLDVSVYPKMQTPHAPSMDVNRKAKIAEVAARLGSNVLFQDAPQLPVPYGEDPPVFYSALQRQVEALKITTAPAEEWKKAINSLMSKGVKKAEIEASGVMEWLDLEGAEIIGKTVNGISIPQKEIQQRGNITKDEVLAYLHSDGETEVRTTIFGEAQQPTDIIQSDEESGVSEEAIENRAEQLWRDQLQEEAERSASEDDYYTYSDPLVRTPNYRIEKLPADMLRGKDQYGVKELVWDVPKGKEMPDNAEELASMYPDGPREKWLEYFGTEAAADAWAQGHEFEDGHTGYDGKPYWTSQDGNGDEIGEYDDKSEAEAGIQSHKEQDFQYAVESYIDNASWSDANQEHFIREAREELTDETPRERNQRLERGNVLKLRHEDSYQLPGGKKQRELVVWVPGIEPYAASDMTHFGDVGQGRAIAWARLSQFDDANGKPVLMVNEFQSLRAQTGRQEGFIQENDKERADLQAQIKAIVDRANVIAKENGFDDYLELKNTRVTGLSEEQVLRLGVANAEINKILDETSPLNTKLISLTRGTVPSAPFVKDTQAWVTLDMKRVIRYAVDNGLDTVTWTTGKQQVGIYTNALRKAIKTITWTKTQDGIEISADGNQIEQTFSDKELRVAAGGAITDQIVNSPEQNGVISGQDIRFDALWPYKFYGDEKGQGPLDQKEIDALKKKNKPVPESKPSIVTAVTNKILAEIGGGKVESIAVQVEPKGQRIGVGAFEREKFVSPNMQPGFRITPEMKKAVLGGFAMFQGEGKRGQISFGDGMGISPTTITLLQNADLSTFLHESGHFYLEVMSHMATQENAAPEIVADMQRILKWFGVPNADVWNAMTLDEKRPYHEQFARGFESYLFEGTAPSPELKSVFARFRAWMLNVYRQLGSLNVQLTDEVRGVMDRMLASNNEIIAAENQRGFAPLFDDAAKMGASPDEWKNYQEQGTAATQDAVDKLQTRSLRDMKWLSNARSAILKQLQASVARLRKGMRAEVAKEVNAQPIYQAMRWLKFGETTSPEGEAVKATQGFKLDTAALATMYPPTALGNPDLSKLGVGKYGMTGTEGLDPNLVAEMFGFGSGDELVRKLIDVEPARSVIEGMTDQRMLERYGDLTSQQAISAAADKAVHNELRARVLATELNALTKATGQKKLLTKAAREFAAAMIVRKKLRDIRPAQFESAEARSARATEKALAAGKLVEAATEKRNELVNNYAAKAAHAALDEIAQGVVYLRKVADSKTIDSAYREQITAMLERFDLRQTTLKEAKRKASLLEWMESQKDQGFEPVIDPEIANEAMRMPYQEMTMEQFRGLTDSVRNIEHLGRLKFKLLKIADQREFAATVDEAVTAITDNAKKTVPQRLEGNTWSAKMKDGVTEFFAMHRKFASLWREMDGFIDGGKLWQLFVRPMNDAGNTETTMREQATIAMQRIFKPLFDLGGLKTKTFIPAINASLSREGRLMVALNTGNDGNLQRLMDGDHWTKAQVDAIVDTLSKPEMDFVQSVWDLIGSYKQQIGDQQKRLTGVAPEWVEPRQVITRHGIYAGGYLPAKYDTTRSTRALADEAAAGIMDQWRGARGLAKTRDSFTKERASKVVNRPLRKDFGVITQHVTEVIHRLSWQEYLTDANRLLRSKGIDNAIREHYGHQTLEALRNTLEDIATGELPAQNAFERSINYIRQGATIAGLGWRLTTALLQPFGLTQSMVRIGPTYVAKGLVEWMGDSVRMENTAARIYEKSEFMRLRAKTLQREINEIRNQVEGKNSALTASYFYLITKMQLVADIPTWLGQYHKAIENGADEDNARAQADQAVIDAQGSGQLKDLAAIQRGGPMLKLFTNFYSFFNTTYNMTAEAFGRTNFKNPLSIGRLMVDVLLLYSVPAALGTFMKAALHLGDDTPDWEDKLMRQLIADQMTYWLGTMVGLREISGAAQTALGLSGDYQGPASVRLFASIAELGKQINQGEVDEALFKAIDNVGGVLFHYPAGQINATVDGIVTMAQGKTDNPGALIVGSNRK